MALDEVYVLTFDAGSAEEGIYTTSTTGTADGASRNAFVAFQDASAAASLAARVAAQAGRACGVQGVPPLALLLLGREAGYTVEAVPRGAPFDTPDVLLQADASGNEGSDPSETPDALEGVIQRMAQRRAAEAVRNALLLPLSRLSASMARAAGLPADTAPGAAPGAGGDDAPPAMPQAASAMATALRAIARRRLEALLPRPDSDDAAGV